MAVAPEAFEMELQAAAGLAQDVSYAIQERDTARRSGGTTSGDSGAIRASIANLERTLERLEAALRDQEAGAGGRAKPAPRVLAQRKEALRRLQAERSKLKDRERAVPASSDRDALLGSGDGKSYGRETEMTRDLTTQEMVSRSNTEIKAQDEVLEKMSRSLDNLKTMGNAVKDEANLHLVRARAVARPCVRSRAIAAHCCHACRSCWMISSQRWTRATVTSNGRRHAWS